MNLIYKKLKGNVRVYKRRGQTSDFKLLSDAKCILGRTVRVKEVDSLPKVIYFSCDHRKIVRLQDQKNCK